MLAYTWPLLSLFWTFLMFAGIVLLLFFIIWCFVDNFRRRDHRGLAKAGAGWNLHQTQPWLTQREALQPREAGGPSINPPDPASRRQNAMAFSNIAATAPHALARQRLGQHLGQRAAPIHALRIHHAIAALGHGIAGFDPAWRLR